MPATFVPRRTAAASRRIRWTRHALQTGIVAWIGWLVWAKAQDASATSPESFCPFGGFETAWTWVTTGGTVPHVHTANLVLAGVIVVLALIGRGFFCGWLCPLGTIQEAVHAAAQAVINRIPPLRRGMRRMGAGMTWWPRVDHVLRYGRYLVLAWAVIGAAVTGVMVFREVDPWSAALAVLEFEISTAFVVLIAVLALSVVVPRPFCRYACPLGAVSGLIGKASPVAIQRDSSACLGCDICNRACPMALDVNSSTRITDAQCITCLECVAACPSSQALAVTVTFPARLPITPYAVDAETDSTSASGVARNESTPKEGASA
jgi:polyferredoxin